MELRQKHNAFIVKGYIFGFYLTRLQPEFDIVHDKLTHSVLDDLSFMRWSQIFLFLRLDIEHAFGCLATCMLKSLVTCVRMFDIMVSENVYPFLTFHKSHLPALRAMAQHQMAQHQMLCAFLGRYTLVPGTVPELSRGPLTDGPEKNTRRQ